jgi:low affinity Fe/Cu permease
MFRTREHGHARVTRHPLRRAFGAVATRASRAAGSAPAFAIAVSVVGVWLFTGPLFGFSDTWQLVINTGTTIVTFLMVFLIQHAQNKDTRALQLKLDELIAAMQGASNRLIDIESLSDEELEALYHRYQDLASRSERLDRGASTSVEETKERPEAKPEARGRKGPPA